MTKREYTGAPREFFWARRSWLYAAANSRRPASVVVTGADLSELPWLEPAGTVCDAPGVEEQACLAGKLRDIVATMILHEDHEIRVGDGLEQITFDTFHPFDVPVGDVGIVEVYCDTDRLAFRSVTAVEDELTPKI